jgi:hypothetical protein
MPDPDFDPEQMNKMRWFTITISFEWIARVWKSVFGSGSTKDKDGNKSAT